MAIIKKYLSETMKVANPFEDLFIASFKSLGKKYNYRPGNYLHLALDKYDPSSHWPDSRCFSIQSSPGSEEITITFSVKGSFTKRMASELCPGKIVTLKLPFGELFSVQHKKEQCVFIAGGTGVTPFLSLFGDARFADFTEPKLYFGVRNRSYNIYDDYLSLGKNINPHFQIHFSAEDEEGILDIGKIFSNTGPDSVFFISGPPEMIKNFKNYLLTAGVPDKNVITDDWE